MRPIGHVAFHIQHRSLISFPTTQIADSF